LAVEIGFIELGCGFLFGCEWKVWDLDNRFEESEIGWTNWKKGWENWRLVEKVENRFENLKKGWTDRGKVCQIEERLSKLKKGLDCCEYALVKPHSTLINYSLSTYPHVSLLLLPTKAAAVDTIDAWGMGFVVRDGGLWDSCCNNNSKNNNINNYLFQLLFLFKWHEDANNRPAEWNKMDDDKMVLFKRDEISFCFGALIKFKKIQDWINSLEYEWCW
jgi:hypothetical protein